MIKETEPKIKEPRYDDVERGKEGRLIIRGRSPNRNDTIRPMQPKGEMIMTTH